MGTQAIRDCDGATCGHDGVEGKKAVRVRRGQPKGGRTWGGRVRPGKLLYVRKYQDHRFLPPLSPGLAWPAAPVPNNSRRSRRGEDRARKGGGWWRSYRRGPHPLVRARALPLPSQPA